MELNIKQATRPGSLWSELWDEQRAAWSDDNTAGAGLTDCAGRSLPPAHARTGCGGASDVHGHPDVAAAVFLPPRPRPLLLLLAPRIRKPLRSRRIAAGWNESVPPVFSNSPQPPLYLDWIF